MMPQLVEVALAQCLWHSNAIQDQLQIWGLAFLGAPKCESCSRDRCGGEAPRSRSSELDFVVWKRFSCKPSEESTLFTIRKRCFSIRLSVLLFRKRMLFNLTTAAFENGCLSIRLCRTASVQSDRFLFRPTRFAFQSECDFFSIRTASR